MWSNDLKGCKFCGKRAHCSFYESCMFKHATSYGIRPGDVADRCLECYEPAVAAYLDPRDLTIEARCTQHMPPQLLTFRGRIQLAALRERQGGSSG